MKYKQIGHALHQLSLVAIINIYTYTAFRNYIFTSNNNKRMIEAYIVLISLTQDTIIESKTNLWDTSINDNGTYPNKNQT